MTNKEIKATHPRYFAWAAIEEKYFGSCVMQEFSADRQTIIEGLIHRRTGMTMIVIKTFVAPIPKGKVWPELSNVSVYVPLGEVRDGTWETLEVELATFERPSLG